MMSDNNSSNPTAAEIGFIGSMSYDDYLSAVYTYEEACENAMRTQSEYEAAKKKTAQLESVLTPLRDKDAVNRSEHRSLLDAEIKRRRELWKKNQARFDFKLSNRRALAEQTAKNDIQNRREEYAEAVKTAQDQAASIETHLRELEGSIDQLRQEQKRFENFTGKSFPPADSGALAVLERAHNKGLLSKGQLDMLDGNVDKACKDRISDCDDLVSIEKKFAKSDFYKKIVEGRVTRKVILGLSNAWAVIFTAFMLILNILPLMLPPSPFSTIVHTAASATAFGGLFASILHALRQRFKQVSELPVPEKTMIAALFTLGCFSGAMIGYFLISPNRGAAVVVACILFCAANGLLFRRILRSDLAAKKLLSKLPFLQDRARRALFADYTAMDNGIYDLMIYCYLKHDAVLLYLSMEYKQSVISSLQEKIEFNRKDQKYSAEELEKAKRRAAELKRSRGDIDDFERQRIELLHEELDRIEAERPREPDFEAEAETAIFSQLEPLDKEHEKLTQEIASANGSYMSEKQKLEAAAAAADQAKSQKKRIANALRLWKKTPVPSSTDYTLLDSFCLDTKSSIDIIHHGCQPYVLRYSVKEPTENPSEVLSPCIYRYIRGLCKINPRRLMQINIFDYISDPHILLHAPSFTKLSDRGVIEGLYSMKDFEIRLFSNAEGYNTFKNFFRLQCSTVRSVIKESSGEFPENVRPDLAMVNRLHDKTGEMFLYQVCMFVVPRESDSPAIRPPKGIMELIDRGIFFRLGILPVFFAECDNVAPSWKPYIDKFEKSDRIHALG